jgi:ABC-type glutathione transport system ATPase component
MRAARPTAASAQQNGAARRRDARLVVVHDLEKLFPLAHGVFLGRERGHVHAVDGVSFEIPRGGTLGLVGESGCGKSTVARLVTRLLEPTGGEIVYDGRDITHWKSRALRPLRREIQLVFQDPYSSLNPRRTVGTIVGGPLRLQRIRTRSERRARVRELLEVVGLKPGALQPLSARVLGDSGGGSGSRGR